MNEEYKLVKTYSIGNFRQLYNEFIENLFKTNFSNKIKNSDLSFERLDDNLNIEVFPWKFSTQTSFSPFLNKEQNSFRKVVFRNFEDKIYQENIRLEIGKKYSLFLKFKEIKHSLILKIQSESNENIFEILRNNEILFTDSLIFNINENNNIFKFKTIENENISNTNIRIELISNENNNEEYSFILENICLAEGEFELDIKNIIDFLSFIEFDKEKNIFYFLDSDNFKKKFAFLEKNISFEISGIEKDSNVLDGKFVYYDRITNKIKLALADGSEKEKVLGVYLNKKIIPFGVVDFSDFENIRTKLQNIEANTYLYLSDVEEGGFEIYGKRNLGIYLGNYKFLIGNFFNDFFRGDLKEITGVCPVHNSYENAQNILYDLRDYINLMALGLKVERPAKVLIDEDVDITSFPYSNFDNINLQNGDRLLLVSQINTNENGLWVYNGINNSLERPDDWNEIEEVRIGCYVFIEGGVKNGGSSWFLKNVDNSNPLIPFNSQEWVKFSAPKEIYLNNPSGLEFNQGKLKIKIDNTLQFDLSNNLGIYQVSLDHLNYDFNDPLNLIPNGYFTKKTDFGEPYYNLDGWYDLEENSFDVIQIAKSLNSDVKSFYSIRNKQNTRTNLRNTFRLKKDAYYIFRLKSRLIQGSNGKITIYFQGADLLGNKNGRTNIFKVINKNVSSDFSEDYFIISYKDNFLLNSNYLFDNNRFIRFAKTTDEQIDITISLNYEEGVGVGNSLIEICDLELYEILESNYILSSDKNFPNTIVKRNSNGNFEGNLIGSSDMLDGYHASLTPNPFLIPVSNENGKLDINWIEVNSSYYFENGIACCGNDKNNLNSNKIKDGLLFYELSTNKLFYRINSNWYEINWRKMIEYDSDFFEERIVIENNKLFVKTGNSDSEKYECIPFLGCKNVYFSEEYAKLDTDGFSRLIYDRITPPGYLTNYLYFNNSDNNLWERKFYLQKNQTFTFNIEGLWYLPVVIPLSYKTNFTSNANFLIIGYNNNLSEKYPLGLVNEFKNEIKPDNGIFKNNNFNNIINPYLLLSFENQKSNERYENISFLKKDNGQDSGFYTTWIYLNYLDQLSDLYTNNFRNQFEIRFLQNLIFVGNLVEDFSQPDFFEFNFNIYQKFLTNTKNLNIITTSYSKGYENSNRLRPYNLIQEPNVTNTLKKLWHFGSFAFGFKHISTANYFTIYERIKFFNNLIIKRLN